VQAAWKPQHDYARELAMEGFWPRKKCYLMIEAHVDFLWAHTTCFEAPGILMQGNAR
jgi:hypothetical protein